MHLSNLVHQYGRISSLILTWTTSLIKEGTRSDQDLSQITISNYLSSASKSIFNELKNEDVENLDDVAFIKRYQRVIEQSSAGQKILLRVQYHHFTHSWKIGLVLYQLKEISFANIWRQCQKRVLFCHMKF